MTTPTPDGAFAISARRASHPKMTVQAVAAKKQTRPVSASFVALILIRCIAPLPEYTNYPDLACQPKPRATRVPSQLQLRR